MIKRLTHTIAALNLILVYLTAAVNSQLATRLIWWMAGAEIDPTVLAVTSMLSGLMVSIFYLSYRMAEEWS